MLFLGTGAAELYPNPFCDCPVCQRARQEGAVPRKRSALLVDEHTLIDFGPEVLAASQMYNAPLDQVDQIFITHSHDDHLCMNNIGVLTMTDKRSAPRTVHLYLSQKAYDWVWALVEATRGLYPGGHDIEKLIEKNRLALHAVTPYASFTAGGMQMFAVESNHKANGKEEYAINYLLDRGAAGKLLYVADSGLYAPRNLEALAGAQVDELVMEGTFGSMDLPRDNSHLNAEHFVEQVEAFRKAGIVTDATRIYVTHINQVQSFSQAEYQAYMDEHAPQPVIVAYDGLRV